MRGTGAMCVGNCCPVELAVTATRPAAGGGGDRRRSVGYAQTITRGREHDCLRADRDNRPHGDGCSVEWKRCMYIVARFQITVPRCPRGVVDDSKDAVLEACGCSQSRTRN